MTQQPQIFIQSGRVVDPASGFDSYTDVVIDAGRISALGIHASRIRDDAVRIDATGKVVCPGFVDLHTHLRFPGFPEKETIGSGTLAAAAGGFTTVCAMANTNPPVDAVDTLRVVSEECSRSAHVHVRQLGSVTVGLAGKELTNLDALLLAGAVAFSDDGKPIADAAIMESALLWSTRSGIAISVHEEDPLLVRGGVANAGPRAARLGLAPWPCGGEASLVQRDIALLEHTGGRLHIAHVSCADTVRVLRAARERGIHLTAEVTPHHLRLTEEALDGDIERDIAPSHPFCKVNPPLRTQADVEACIDALADGVIDAVATDHAPHTSADKATDFAAAAFGFSGIETALPLVLELVRLGRLTLAAAVERLTCGPARVFNLQAGTMAVGAPADICVFDPDALWKITPEALYSRGKNSPLVGTNLRGRVNHTIVGGEIVYAL